LAKAAQEGGALRSLTFALSVALLVTLATLTGDGAAAAATVIHGNVCTIGLPTPDNQGVFFTTDKTVTVVTDDGAAVTHCTFVGTGYTPPGEPFPFTCVIGPNEIVADIVQLEMQGGNVILTCISRPAR
jgi:hypothetical protein